MMISSLVLCGFLLLGQTTEGEAGAATGTTVDAAATVERLYAEGAAFFKAGQHQLALDKFELAYTLFPEPNLLFNMARAHEGLGELDKALARYRLCANDPATSPDIAARARDNVSRIEAAQAQQAAEAAEAAEAAAAEAAAAAAAQATVETTPTSTATVAATTPMSTWSTPVGGTLTAVGALGLVAGGVFYGLGSASHMQVEAAKRDLDDNGVAPLTRVQATELVQSGADNKQRGVALGVVGAVLGLAGGAVWVVGSLQE